MHNAPSTQRLRQGRRNEAARAVWFDSQRTFARGGDGPVAGTLYARRQALLSSQRRGAPVVHLIDTCLCTPPTSVSRSARVARRRHAWICWVRRVAGLHGSTHGWRGRVRRRCGAVARVRWRWCWCRDWRWRGCRLRHRRLLWLVLWLREGWADSGSTKANPSCLCRRGHGLHCNGCQGLHSVAQCPRQGF